MRSKTEYFYNAKKYTWKEVVMLKALSFSEMES